MPLDNSALVYCVTEENLHTLVNHKITQHLVLVLGHYKGQDIQMATLKLLALVLSQGNQHIKMCNDVVKLSLDVHKLLFDELLSPETIELIAGAVKLFPDHPVIIAAVLDVLAAIACTGELVVGYIVVVIVV